MTLSNNNNYVVIIRAYWASPNMLNNASTLEGSPHYAFRCGDTPKEAVIALNVGNVANHVNITDTVYICLLFS